MMRLPTVAAITVAGATLSMTSLARAQLQDPMSIPEAQRFEAEDLLDKGRTLMLNPKKLDEACDTLQKSWGLFNRGDTLLNLAECHRRQGKTATAWREFDEAIRYAQDAKFEAAIDKAAELRQKLAQDLSGLFVAVPADLAKEPSLVVILDGKKLPKQQWNVQLWVDPGTHPLTATATGYESFESSSTIKDQADRGRIEVTMKAIPKPPPPDKPPPPKPPPPKPAPIEEGEAPIWAIVVGSTGVAMMAVSVGFGVDSLNATDELDQQCGVARKRCKRTYDFEGPRATELRSFGLFLGFGIGGLAATTAGAIGLGLGLAGGEQSEDPVAVLPWATPDGFGISTSGRF